MGTHLGYHLNAKLVQVQEFIQPRYLCVQPSTIYNKINNLKNLEQYFILDLDIQFTQNRFGFNFSIYSLSLSRSLSEMSPMAPPKDFII